jgi:hypothetical protein
MKKTEHPVQLPDSLITKWLEDTDTPLSVQFQEASEWGADAELEACCEWLASKPTSERKIPELRDARRPKQSSLKEMALMALEDGDIGSGACLAPVEVSIIRRALEALPE